MGDNCPFTQMDEEKRRSGSMRLLQALFPERFAGSGIDPRAEHAEQEEAVAADQRCRTARYV